MRRRAASGDGFAAALANAERNPAISVVNALSRRRPTSAAAPAAVEVDLEEVSEGPRMNKTETRYMQRLVAEGRFPRFAALTLCVTFANGRRRRYTPDFTVMRADRVLELHEVKGPYVYDDARLKFDFAVEQWGEHYDFVWSQWRGGKWHTKRFPRRDVPV